MITYRLGRKGEAGAIIRFANRVFNGAGDPIKFEYGIPKVYDPSLDRSQLHYLAVDDEKGIRANVATLPVRLHVAERELKLGYVGTVSVHPESRGEGHMKALMRLTEEKARREGFDLLYLGGRKQRYAYFGFETSGLSYEAEITEDNVRHALGKVSAENVVFEEMTEGSPWLSMVRELHEKEWLYAERENFPVWCRNFSGKPWMAMQDGALIGYAVQRANGYDLSELLAISSDAEEKMVKAWQNIHQIASIRVTIPGWKLPMLRRIAAYAEGVSMGTNARVKVLNWLSVIEALLNLRAMGCRLEDGRLELKIGEEAFTIEVAEGVPTVRGGAVQPLRMNHEQAERLMFDPFAMEGYRNWFPLPLFLPQADEF